jgi:hypothetical protein
MPRGRSAPVFTETTNAARLLARGKSPEEAELFRVLTTAAAHCDASPGPWICLCEDCRKTRALWSGLRHRKHRAMVEWPDEDEEEDGEPVLPEARP